MAPTANVAMTARRVFLRFIVRPFSAFHCFYRFDVCQDSLQQALEGLDLGLREAFKKFVGHDYRGGQRFRVELLAFGSELELDGAAVFLAPHAAHRATL